VSATRSPHSSTASRNTGPIDNPDVVVEGDAEGLYYLFIDAADGVSISGDRACSPG